MPDDQQEVIAFLSQPSSYGGSGSEKVDRIETHASIVFLIGPTALKLKKKVRYAYLDYSTIALRRRFCEAELQLNRRTAPQLYRRVRAITREADGRLAFDGDGPALDWVVEMARFDQAKLFSSLAESGGLTHSLLEDLVQQIVAFHHDAEPVHDLGGAAGVEEVIAINDRSLRAAGLSTGSVDQVRDLSQQALARTRLLLDRRRDEGKVRRCHGDLHLGNICLVAGRPTLFDGIEFNDSIACIDTLYDFAFLLMDLCQRGMTSEANLIFNRHLDLSGDVEGLAALPLFLSLRAAVRAHVTALARTVDALAKAKAYLDFALAVVTPVPPRLVAIGGLSGTGKSTVAAAIAPQLGACPGARVLRSDVLRKQRAGKAPTERLGPEFYTAAASASLYREIRALTRRVLATGYSVVIDAVSALSVERDSFEEEAKALGVAFHGVWLEAPAEVLEQRLLAREGDASDATPAVLRRQLGYDLGPMRWTRIDVGQDRDTTLRRVREVLSRDGAAD